MSFGRSKTVCLPLIQISWVSDIQGVFQVFRTCVFEFAKEKLLGYGSQSIRFLEKDTEKIPFFLTITTTKHKLTS